jgi:hypothetical protein
LITVLRDIPDAAATAVLPPRPNIPAAARATEHTGSSTRDHTPLQLVHVRKHDFEEPREPFGRDLHNHTPHRAY